ncbi:choice-of-anchor U domain-containing protein [Marinilabilia salmonicolor]|uniref:choice-of-anchor U domain-containing protein n=1 Tax=Marinilabilia salmonicolor TaxID=989 RepID=UPI000299CF29|nr:choice-of-anchor U domain-containing protein [Marinilabilia salmonicolor]
MKNQYLFLLLTGFWITTFIPLQELRGQYVEFVQITDDANIQTLPAIDGNYIVWEDYRNGPNGDIYLYNRSDGTEIALTSDIAVSSTNPAISGNRVVWSEKGEIYIYDINTPQIDPHPLLVWAGTEKSLAIHGDVLVGSHTAWTEPRTWNVFMYDFTTGQLTLLTDDDNGDQENPDVYGDYVVWQDQRSGDWDIYMYHIPTGTETQLTDDPADQTEPAVYGKRVVWQDTRNGDYDIYMHHMTFGLGTVFENFDWALWNLGQYNSDDQMHPDIYGDHVVWQDDRNGDWDLYLFTFINDIAGNFTRMFDVEHDQTYPGIYDKFVAFKDSRDYDGGADIWQWEMPPGCDLSLVVEDEPDPVATGNELVYTVYVKNIGEQEADDVLVTCTLPAGVDYIYAYNSTGNGASRVDDEVFCDLGTMGYNDVDTVKVYVTPLDEGSPMFTALVETSDDDINQENNTQSISTEVILAFPDENETGTVPDYSYGEVLTMWGTVTDEGVANPGPRGGYSESEEESPSGVFLANGERWWGYPEALLLICNGFPAFNYPGFHGVWDMSHLACSSGILGHMAAWGGVVIEPEERMIRCLGGAINQDDGPTNQYCVPNPFGSGEICYGIPSQWGYLKSYGYLRKVVKVQSTGVLLDGDPVNISASLTSQGVYDGDGTIISGATLFLNKISETPGHQWGLGRDYLTSGNVADIAGTPEMLNNMLGYITYMGLNTTENTSGTVAIGDTIVVEIAFDNTVTQENPGDRVPGSESEGWVGERPDDLFSDIAYTRTDSVRNLIKNNGNSLTYNLTSETPGAALIPLAQAGPNQDTDNDGIIDAREKGPDVNENDYDGNVDGLPDYEQANVASFHTFDGENYVTLVVPEDTELSQVVVTDNPSPGDSPEDAEFPFGFFDFSIDGLDLGEAVTVTLYLHGGETVDNYFKYGYTPDNNELHWYEFMYDGETGAEISGDVITLHFVDGLRGDEDITVNGSIKEPGGPMKDVSTGVEEVAEPGAFILEQNYPNPFTGQTKIGYQLNSPARVIISVFNLSGEKVKILVSQNMPQGKHEIFWDGRDNSGKSLNSGIYFYQMEVISENGGTSKMKKMVLLQ